MPLSTPTLLAAATNSSGGTVSTGTIGPTGSSLVIATASMGGSTSPGDLNISDNFGGGIGTWNVIRRHNHSTGAWVAAAFWAFAAASPGTGVVTVDDTNDKGTRNVLHVVEVASGFHLTTPIRQSNSGEATSGATFSVVLASSLLADSIAMGMLAARADSDNAITPGAQFTELADSTVSTGPNSTTHETEYDATSPTTTVDWSGLGTPSELVGIAFEIAAAGAATTIKDIITPGIIAFPR